MCVRVREGLLRGRHVLRQMSLCLRVCRGGQLCTEPGTQVSLTRLAAPRDPGDAGRRARRVAGVPWGLGTTVPGHHRARAPPPLGTTEPGRARSPRPGPAPAQALGTDIRWLRCPALECPLEPRRPHRRNVLETARIPQGLCSVLGPQHGALSLGSPQSRFPVAGTPVTPAVSRPVSPPEARLRHRRSPWEVAACGEPSLSRVCLFVSAPSPLPFLLLLTHHVSSFCSVLFPVDSEETLPSTPSQRKAFPPCVLRP